MVYQDHLAIQVTMVMMERKESKVYRDHRVKQVPLDLRVRKVLKDKLELLALMAGMGYLVPLGRRVPQVIQEHLAPLAYLAHQVIEDQEGCRVLLARMEDLERTVEEVP